MEASPVEGMLERDATENEEEVERGVYTMNEEVAARDAVNNPETPVPEERSTQELVQGDAHDGHRHFETTTEQS